mgnify:FL=1
MARFKPLMIIVVALLIVLPIGDYAYRDTNFIHAAQYSPEIANRDELGVLEHLTQSDPIEIQIANRATVRDSLGQTPKLSGAESREVVQGATYTVNSTGVAGDSYLEDGICDTANNPTIGDGIPPIGICTIVAAVQQANFTVDPNNINFSIP